MENSEGEKPTAKILIFGLDNSGKTSIFLSLQGNTNLLSLCKLKPTKGLSINDCETSNYNMSIWDFGGQEQYRIGYLKKLPDYLTKLTKMIYIIDVQDYERYNIALEYLEKILVSIKEEGLSLDLSIYLHKYDPGIKELPKFEKIDEKIEKEILLKIVDMIPNTVNLDVFKTTIYTTFEKSSVSFKNK